MKRKKLWIGIGMVLVLLVGLGYYGNSQINKMIDKLVSSGLVQADGGSLDAGEAQVQDSNKSPNNAAGNVNGGTSTFQSTGTSAAGDSTSTGSAVSPGTVPVDSNGEILLTPEQNRIVTGAENRVGRKIDRRDILTVGNIVIRHFSWGEINYLYNVGSAAGAFHLSKDAHQVRNLLLSRLGPGEISTLTSIGNKYGLKVRILDPNWDLDKKRWVN